MKDQPGPETDRALSLLDAYEQVLPAIFATLTGIRCHVDQVLSRQHVTREAWQEMSIEAREALLGRDRKTKR